MNGINTQYKIRLTKKKNHKLGVIVPYRDRYDHLIKFKRQMVRYLDTTDIDYVIIIVEQDDAKLFNRGSLLNIGFKRAIKEGCDYVVFHDVDLLPLKVDYSYEEVPIHLATDLISNTNDDFKRESFDSYFGGVTIFPVDTFRIINGYSNQYWGWGFEDDDLFTRCIMKGIPYDTKVKYVAGGSDVALRYNGVDSYCQSNLDLKLDEPFSIFLTIDPDGVICDGQKNYDRYTALSIPSIDLTISYDSFRRYKLLLKDKDGKWSYIDSKIDTNRKTNICVTVNPNRKKIKMYQDGDLIGETKFSKELRNFRKKDLFIGSKNGSEEMFKGVISDVAFFQKILINKSIRELSNNTDYSLTMNFGDYKDESFLTQYYNMKMIRDYKVLNLMGFDNPLIINKCEIVKYEKPIEQLVKLPFRKVGYFKTLSHESSGYKDGSWSDINIRYNQMRFHNEMEKGYKNIEEDGLSNLKYKLWDETKQNKRLIHMNIGI